MTIRISINGALGKMGQMIYTVSKSDKDVEVVELVDKGRGDVGGHKIVQKLTKKVDCVIEFSTPDGSIEALKSCTTLKNPVVIGTTGHTKAQEKQILEASKIVPVLKSTNMSIGVNLLFTILERIKDNLGGFDIGIVETHHKAKRDKPSGTAITLGEIIGHEGDTHSFRLADIKGEHTVVIARNGEVLELTHRAYTREIFAAGAIEAAKRVAKKKPGLYNFREMLFPA